MLVICFDGYSIALYMVHQPDEEEALRSLICINANLCRILKALIIYQIQVKSSRINTYDIQNSVSSASEH